MTKSEFLYQMLHRKDHWQVPMPVFGEQQRIIEIEKGSTYQGVITIHMEDGLLFECLVESLKGLVNPLTPFISGQSPIVEYKIESTGLEIGFVYEDRLTFWYNGGKHMLNIRFLIMENQVIDVVDEVEFQPSKDLDESKIKKVGEEAEIVFIPQKRTFYIMEPAIINVINKSKRPKRVIFECDEDYVFPSTTEVYLRMEWSQEWFVKQSVINRFLSSLVSSNPFKSFNLNVFIDGDDDPVYSQVITMTELKPYVTPQIITSEKEFKTINLQIQQLYIKSVNQSNTRKESHYIFDIMKACLNYDLKNWNLKLLYIWILMEFDKTKEAKSELASINRYIQVYESQEAEELVDLLQKVIVKDKHISEQDFANININSHWLLILLKARYSGQKQTSYDYYRQLYEKGYRKSYLLAESVAFLNKNSVSIEKDDRLYIGALRWAINKGVISNHWLNRLERGYYQLEKNLYFDRRIGEDLYRLKPGKNLLRLLANCCMEEEAYDFEAFQVYEKTLDEKLYLSELDKYYMISGWKNGEELKFEKIKHHSSISSLPEKVREYVYLSIMNVRTGHGLLYRKIYPRILYDFEVKTNYTDMSYQILNTYFDSWISEKEKNISRIIKYANIKKMAESKPGKELLTNLLGLAYSHVEFDTIGIKIIEEIGLVGISKFCDLDSIYSFYHHWHENVTMDKKILKNDDYKKESLINEPLASVLKTMLVDDFISFAYKDIQKIKDEEWQELEALWYQFLSRKVVFNDELINEEWQGKLLNYYTKQKEKHDIIEATLCGTSNSGTFDSIQYYARENALVDIYFRYPEDEEFQIGRMKPSAFGVYTYPVKLFFGDVFEYYIVVEFEGKRELVHSSLIEKTEEELGSQSGNYIEEGINGIALSYHLNDEVSAREMIDEYSSFFDKINRIPRL